MCHVDPEKKVGQWASDSDFGLGLVPLLSSLEPWVFYWFKYESHFWSSIPEFEVLIYAHTWKTDENSI